MSAEALVAFHVGLNAAIRRWAWMIQVLQSTDSIVAYHASLALLDIQPDAIYIDTAVRSPARRALDDNTWHIFVSSRRKEGKRPLTTE